MTDAAPDRLLESWRAWVDKVLDCGVANVGAHTAGEIRSWAELAEAAGWREDADLARAIVAGERPVRERAGSFLGSASRLELARGLWLLATLRSTAQD